MPDHASRSGMDNVSHHFQHPIKAQQQEQHHESVDFDDKYDQNKGKEPEGDPRHLPTVTQFQKTTSK